MMFSFEARRPFQLKAGGARGALKGNWEGGGARRWQGVGAANMTFNCLRVSVSVILRRYSILAESRGFRCPIQWEYQDK